MEQLAEVAESGSSLILEVSHHPDIAKNLKDLKEHKELMDQHNNPQIELANNLIALIDDKIREIHKAVKTVYSQRFPELKLPDPMQYIITVQLLGNRPSKVDDEAINSQLREMLEPKMLLLVSMHASTTQGVKLEQEVMEKVLRACAVATHLAHLRAKLLAFVERNLSTIAPNLSAIVGAPIAAKLMGLAGGLMKLSTMPSCNVPILGSNKLSRIESDVSIPPRMGHIYECDLIQQIPFDHTKDIRKRAVKWVANKCVLAARCDVSQSDLDGKAGKMFREKIEAMISKELEPPPKKAPRPLPAPIEKSGKKRGGKRARRMKERYAQTELRKAANRIAFGDVGDDAYQNDLGFDRSQLKAIQKLRGPQINEKTKIRLSKAAQKKLAQSHNLPKPADSEGITVKTENQELEIYNPKAKESYASTSNYFSSTATFLKL